MKAAKANPKLSFIVPAFNEEANIADTVEEIHKIGTNLTSYEIVIVNDGSVDATKDIIEKLAVADDTLTLANHETNKGFGASYRKGFETAVGEYCILIPGDNSHPANTVSPILDKMGMADIVIPYVINPNVRQKRRQLLSKLFVIIVNTLTGLRLPYYNGLVLHRTHLLQNVCSTTSGYAYQAEILVNLIRGGASYTTVATEISERATGETKAFKPKNVIQVILTLGRLALR